LCPSIIQLLQLCWSGKDATDAKPNDSPHREIVRTSEMSKGNRTLLQLTDLKNLPWAAVAAKFKEQIDKRAKVPELQMRRKDCSIA
jgi:hypothetical protein